MWGTEGVGIPPPTGLANVVAVVAGYSQFSLAVKSDGTVVGWGANLYGEITIPTGLANVTAAAAGVYHSLALKSDGRVVVLCYTMLFALE